MAGNRRHAGGMRSAMANLQKYRVADCDRWNAENPVGSDVVLTKDSGEQVATKTRSEAYVCDAGYPVIFLEGVSGYYLLERVVRTSAHPTPEQP